MAVLATALTEAEARDFALWARKQGFQILPNRAPSHYLLYAVDHQSVGCLARAAGGKILPNYVAAPHVIDFRGGIAAARIAQRERIRQRDGRRCCICGYRIRETATPTLEHWLARSVTHHSIYSGDANCGLAHRRCNELVGALPVTHKVAIAVELRRQLEIDPTIIDRVPQMMLRRALLESAGLSLAAVEESNEDETLQAREMREAGDAPPGGEREAEGPGADQAGEGDAAGDRAVHGALGGVEDAGAPDRSCTEGAD